MSIQDPGTVRAELRTAILNGITALQAVYGYFPKDLKGQSPVCTIERLAIQPNIKTAVNLQSYDFAVTFWVLADGASGSGLTAEDAENMLDDLIYALCTVLMAEYNAEFFQGSEQVQMAMESGNVYQVETHYVRISRP